jgi:hypothetical protein
MTYTQDFCYLRINQHVGIFLRIDAENWCAMMRAPSAGPWRQHTSINVLFAFSDSLKGIIGFLKPT